MSLETINSLCALCGAIACDAEPGAKKNPPFCPMPQTVDRLEQVKEVYHEQEDLHSLALESARTEAAGY